MSQTFHHVGPDIQIGVQVTKGTNSLKMLQGFMHSAAFFAQCKLGWGLRMRSGVHNDVHCALLMRLIRQHFVQEIVNRGFSLTLSEGTCDVYIAISINPTFSG